MSELDQLGCCSLTAWKGTNLPCRSTVGALIFALDTTWEDKLSISAKVRIELQASCHNLKPGVAEIFSLGEKGCSQ